MLGLVFVGSIRAWFFLGILRNFFGFAEFCGVGFTVIFLGYGC